MPELLKLPQLVGSREAADEMISTLPDVKGEVVVIDCTDLISGSVSFADQLVVRLLDEKGAERLEIIDASDEFWDYLSGSAEEIGRVDSVVKASRGRLLVR